MQDERKTKKQLIQELVDRDSLIRVLQKYQRHQPSHPLYSPARFLGGN